MSDNKVAISVVLYNENNSRFDKLYKTIISSEVIDKFYVIDNSKVPCIDRSLYRNIEYYHCPENPGYGAGHNLALKQSVERSLYHFVINPDVQFKTSDLFKLVSRMDHSSDVGMLMPKVRNTDGSLQYVCRLLPNPMEIFLRRFIPRILYSLASGYLENKELRFTGYKKEMEVPFLSGCFMVLRMTVIEKIGFFDERYFMYAEDLDLSRRIYRESRCLFYPTVEVVHEHCRGSYNNFKMMTRHIISIIRYFNKWGWFFDFERRKINRQTVSRIKANL